MMPVFSLIALLLLVLLIAGGVAFSAGRHAGHGRLGGWFGQVRPALVVLLGVLAACLAGWLLPLASAHL